jgi:outer membrane protein assembly factor BamB
MDPVGAPFRTPPPRRCFLGTNCHVLCLDAQTGATLWQRDLREPNTHSRVVTLLIDGERLFATCLWVAACVNIADGRVLWRTVSRYIGEPSSLALEQGQLIVAGLGHVLALSSESGALQWQNDLPGLSFHPICLRVPGGTLAEPPTHFTPPRAPAAPPEDPESDPDPWL